MKKYICILIMCICSVLSINAVNVDDLKGKWVNGPIVLTITNDSLIFDEVGNEGFVYTYTVSNDDIIFRNEIDEDVIHVIYLDKNEITYYLDDDKSHIYTLKKKITSNKNKRIHRK